MTSHYGYDALYEIDKRSGWIDADCLDDYISALEYEKRMVSSFTKNQKDEEKTLRKLIKREKYKYVKYN